MPKASVLSPKECLMHMPAIIRQFQEETVLNLEKSGNINNKSFLDLNNNIQKQHKYYTRHMLLDELLQAVELNMSSFTQEEYKTIRNITDRLKECSAEHTYGLNYGKSLLNHVVLWNYTPYLLPSGEIYWGRLVLMPP